MVRHRLGRNRDVDATTGIGHGAGVETDAESDATVEEGVATNVHAGAGVDGGFTAGYRRLPEEASEGDDPA